ncbi:MAG: hypothetical protein KatS3mg096_701 [Candidatus Parcubacteria bacterium]|nr:MAG: hypothetical protein KatS3mg096_674 [Candidatus Parcubacteria bacterium]GIW67833.1 MAG: hypothetical protein KatS3mg096_701 [Candidatus Parcubacteria bacterium]
MEKGIVDKGSSDIMDIIITKGMFFLMVFIVLLVVILPLFVLPLFEIVKEKNEYYWFCYLNGKEAYQYKPLITLPIINFGYPKYYCLEKNTEVVNSNTGVYDDYEIVKTKYNIVVYKNDYEKYFKPKGL